MRFATHAIVVFLFLSFSAFAFQKDISLSAPPDPNEDCPGFSGDPGDGPAEESQNSRNDDPNPGDTCGTSQLNQPGSFPGCAMPNAPGGSHFGSGRGPTVPAASKAPARALPSPSLSQAEGGKPAQNPNVGGYGKGGTINRAMQKYGITQARMGAPYASDSDACGDYESGLVTLKGDYRLLRQDLFIEGVGIDWRFSRFYRQEEAAPFTTISGFDSHFGHGWGFTYGDRLQINGAQSLSLFESGRLRATQWQDPENDGTFTAGGFWSLGENSVIFRKPDNSYERIQIDGTIWTYNAQGLLTSLADRNGNQMQFLHGENGAPPDALTTVIDTLGREIHYEYFEVGEGKALDGKLWKVSDFTGRVVLFGYDEIGNLTSVTTPPVNTTFSDGANLFPQGKKEIYSYEFDAFGRSALTSIIRPNENDSNYGEEPDLTPLLFNIFDPSTAQVIGQLRGPQSDVLGSALVQTISFDYSYVSDPETELVEFDAKREDTPVKKVTVLDRNGNERRYYLSQRGAVTRSEIMEQNVLSGTAIVPSKLLITRFRYDSQLGQLAEKTFPSGRRELLGYVTVVSPELAFPANVTRTNLQQKIEYPAPKVDPLNGQTIVSDQPSRKITFTTEPFFNQVLTLTDERGNDPSFTPPISGAPNPERYVTQYFYDFMEGDSASIQAMAARYHRTLTPEVIAALAKNQDLNGDGITNQQKGNCIKTIYPTVQLDPASPQVQIEGSETQSAFSVQGYNALGQISYHVDTEGNLTRYVYDPPAQGGFLRQEIVDTSNNAGLNSALFPARRESADPIEAHYSYDYDARGNQIRFTDPKGTIYRYDRNERDQVYRAISAEGSEEEQEIRFEYDANDQLIRKSIHNPISPAGPWVVEEYDFDLENRKIRERNEIETSLFAQTLFAFDSNGNLRVLVQPEGNRIESEFNARDQRVQTTRGAGSPQSARSEFFYDENGNLALTRQHTEGASDQQLDAYLLYDGYDRFIGSLDPVGTRVRLTLDPAGNAISKAVYGYPGGPSPLDASGVNNVLLASSQTDFDERSRAYEIRADVFGDQGHGGESGASVVQRFAYDRLGRVTFSTEHDGDTYQIQYDGRSRVSRRIDPLNNEAIYFYDDNDNLLETTQTDRASLSQIAEQRFTTTIIYDALNRLTQVSDNLGQTKRFAYDLQNNVIYGSDANGPLSSVALARFQSNIPGYLPNLEGNVSQFFYDGLNRLIKKEILLTNSGLGVGSLNPPLDLNQSGDGKITVQSEWDLNSRLIRQIDDQGNKTRTVYDALNRAIAIQYGEGSPEQTVESFQFDGADRLIQKTDQNGSVVGYEYDLVSRLSRKFIVSGAPGLIGTSEQILEYDGLGRLTLSSDISLEGEASFTRSYDSLSRLYLENQGFGNTSANIESFWQAGNLRSSLLYPNGRTVLMQHDALNRVHTVDQNIESEFIGGRLLERRYPNGSKLLYHNGSIASGYDRVARTTRLRWLNSNNQTIADFGYGYDRENHRTSTRRYHELSATNKPKGETYRYDSAYRLVEWKEGALFEGGGNPLPGVPGDSIVGGGILGGGNPGSGSRRSGGNTHPGLEFANPNLPSIGEEGPGWNHATITDQQSWTLDGVGNWSAMSRRGVLMNSSISAHNEYTSFGNQAQTHDSNGNLRDDGTFFYDYDFLNRLRRVVKKTNLLVVATYEYDALNRRVSRETTSESAVGVSSTRYFYDGWHAIEERDASNTTTKQFVYGERLDEILKMDRYSGGSVFSTYYYHSDVLGSVVALSDASGNVVERVKYSPYGQPYFLDQNQQPIRDPQGVFALQSSVGNPLLFTAARFDAELSQRTNTQTTDKPGHYYLRNRYLNPNQGRFITRDPIGVWTDSANLGGGYTYAGNDPVNQIDPLGLACHFKEEEEEEEDPYKDRYAPMNPATSNPEPLQGPCQYCTVPIGLHKYGSEFHFLGHGYLNDATEITMRAGQAVKIDFQNVSPHGMLLEISDLSIPIPGTDNTQGFWLPVPGKTGSYSSALFGCEPMQRTFSIDSMSDSFAIIYDIWSTWVQTMPPNQ